MAEKTLEKKDEHKFLGKEVTYYDGLFRLWLAIMNKVGKGEDITNLVNHLDASFPYKDEEYIKELAKAEEILNNGINISDKFGRADMTGRQKAIIEFTMKKYELLLKLFKRKKVIPQEAEDETYGE